MTTPPAILLVRPQMGENIGAAARVMANFGLRELRLVAPRDGWPNPKAADMAAKALAVIDDAVVYETTAKAVADKQFVLATSARERAMNTPSMNAREAMQEIHRRAAQGEHCAVMFGPERTGLENEDIAVADALISIPVTAEYPSLNLAQAVAVVAYEWGMVAGIEGRESNGTARSVIARPSGRSNPDKILLDCFAPLAMTERASPPSLDSRLSTLDSLPAAPRAELLGLFDQLEAALDAVNFWRVPEKKETMWLNIRATLLRTGLTSAEIATWRGIIKGLRG